MQKTDVGNTQDLVAIKEIKEGTLVLKDGGLRQIIMVGGVNFALKSEMEQNILTQGYQNFLNSVSFPLQIVIHSRKVNIEKYLDELAGYQIAETSPLLKNQGEEYREFIRGFVQKNAIMEKSFFVTIPFTPIKLPTPKSVSLSASASLLPPLRNACPKNLPITSRISPRRSKLPTCIRISKHWNVAPFLKSFA